MVARDRWVREADAVVVGSAHRQIVSAEHPLLTGRPDDSGGGLGQRFRLVRLRTSEHRSNIRVTIGGSSAARTRARLGAHGSSIRLADQMKQEALINRRAPTESVTAAPDQPT